LVVGQPVLVEGDGVAKSLLKKGLKNAILSYVDRDLPHYAQYKDLVSYIKSSNHSVVILTGDVHFGRIACGELKPGSGSVFVEVISSPMHAVMSDKDEPLFGSYKNAPTNHFSINEDREVLQRRNHFVTVRFFLGEDGRVNIEVRAWPILLPGQEVSPSCDVVFEKALS
jgi:phosphodiesterase/alkaline phosphatase D-like protein